MKIACANTLPPIDDATYIGHYNVLLGYSSNGGYEAYMGKTTFEPPREKTNNLPRRKQRRRSASR